MSPAFIGFGVLARSAGKKGLKFREVVFGEFLCGTIFDSNNVGTGNTGNIKGVDSEGCRCDLNRFQCLGSASSVESNGEVDLIGAFFSKAVGALSDLWISESGIKELMQFNITGISALALADDKSKVAVARGQIEGEAFCVEKTTGGGADADEKLHTGGL